jgi:hypothetical protein
VRELGGWARRRSWRRRWSTARTSSCSGRSAAARRALERARALATERKLTLALAAATFVEGDLALRAGRRGARSALPIGVGGVRDGDSSTAPRARCTRRRGGALAGQADDGRRALAEADALRAPGDDDAERARALRALALADGGGEPAPAAADRLDRLARRVRAASAARRRCAWRCWRRASRSARAPRTS